MGPNYSDVLCVHGLCNMCPHGLKLIASRSFASSGVIHMSSPTGSEYILTDGVLVVVVLMRGSCCRCWTASGSVMLGGLVCYCECVSLSIKIAGFVLRLCRNSWC